MQPKTIPFALLMVVGLVLAAPAAPPNTALLDGRPTEYDGVDLAGTFVGSNAWGSADGITNLYVTWDATYLYLALQGWESGNKLAVLLDADPGAGTGATTTTNWSRLSPPYIGFNDVGWQASADPGAESFGLDFVFASEGYYNDVLRITYDGLQTPDTNNVENIFPTGDNGSTPRGTPVDMVVLADGTECRLKGFEARIPWSVLYTNDRHGTVEAGEVVPRGAQIRLFANLHNNDTNSAYSSPDAIPEQTNAAAGGGWTDGLLTTANYIARDVDVDDDGFPDVAGTDVNAPFLRAVAGAASNAVVYTRFNENVTTNTATNVFNWAVGEQTPASVERMSDSTFLLHLTNILPAAGTLVRVAATGIEDASANSKYTYLCLFPTDSGLTTSVTVRFVLETASGLGSSPGASAFHVNGSAEPMEWGYPPATSLPLAVQSGTLYFREVTFPPGTPARIAYKYSGKLDNTGTNNFEAIRLHEYADASRWLTLPDDGSSLVVTDYLGAAAHPWRYPTNTADYTALYSDTRRGDAGVRERTTVTFRLDLSPRDLYNVQRVLIVGGDPLRGFNVDDAGWPDWPGNPVYVDWLLGGLDLFDDGTHGDDTAGDGIYSRQWSFTTTGTDAAMEPGLPYSLVGGNYGSTLPYYGAWANRRSPRSFAYKYAVVYGAESALLDPDPGGNIEYYMETGATNIVLDPRVWANNDLPFKPAANPPQAYRIEPQGNTTRILFTNALGEAQHGVQMSTNLTSPWLDYGQMAAGSGGNWTVTVQNAGSTPEFFRLYSGTHAFRGVWWDPNPLPETGGVMRIFYTQYSRGLAGDQNVQIAGNFPPSSWGPLPMTFLGDGTWFYDLNVDTNTFANPVIEFKPRNLSGSIWEGFGGGGDNYLAYRGDLRATWSPNSPTNEEVFTITYDQAGGPLAASGNVSAHVGFDEPWGDVSDRVMTNIGGTVWELAFPVPTNATLSVNFVFTDGALWDSKDFGGRDWRAFIGE